MPFAQCNDVRLYYETEGEGDPLVFIHGLGSSSRDWEPQTGIFFFRLPHYGPSIFGATADPTSPRARTASRLFASDTFRLLEALDIPDPPRGGASPWAAWSPFRWQRTHPDS